MGHITKISSWKKNLLFAAAIATTATALSLMDSALAQERTALTGSSSKASTAPRERLVRSFDINEKGLGSLRFQVRDAGEPVYQPFRMTLSVKCGATEKALSKVEWEKILNEESICDYTRYDFDKNTKVLTIYFSTSEVSPGEAECNSHWSQTFNLRQLCKQ